MNIEIALALLVGALLGAGFACWRTMVYARKLRHFDINLDKWAQYDEHIAQARRATLARPHTKLFGSQDE